ncbi:Long-chain-fatty-acid--CoA ligase FadD15 [Streptomyces hirsutus]
MWRSWRARYQWTVLCYALWTVGAEVVPIYPTSSREQVEWILRDSGCVAVVVEDEQGVMTVGSVCAALPGLRHIWQLDSGALDQLAARGKTYRRPRSTRRAGSHCRTPRP